MFSLDFKGGKDAAFDFLRARADRAQRRLARRRGNADLPPEEHHPLRACRDEELAESGVTDGLVRISVGIEDWRDLLADFEQALAAIQ